jgi:hypothetical protein
MKNARTLILFLLLGLIPCPAFAEPAGAIVVKISGTVWLKHDGKQIRLNPKSDVARVLYVGESVHCEKGATLSLNIGGRTRELNERDGWFPIAIPRRAAAMSDPHQKVLDAYGRIGGRDKGFKSKSIVYSPTNDGAVVPELFVIRWTPTRRRCFASWEIQTQDGQQLWRQEKVAGTSGVLESTTAREALTKYRASAGARSLILKLKGSCGNDDQITFGLLSVPREKSLNEELALWDREPDKLIVHIGRATVFNSYSLLPQAAEELAAALVLAPNSRALLQKTSGANWATGNLPRAKQLERRLSRQVGSHENRKVDRND